MTKHKHEWKVSYSSLNDKVSCLCVLCNLEIVGRQVEQLILPAYREESTLATVDPLPNIAWSAKAVLGDALNRCPENATVLVVWENADGTVNYSKNTKTVKDLVHLIAWADKQLVYPTGE